MSLSNSPSTPVPVPVPVSVSAPSSSSKPSNNSNNDNNTPTNTPEKWVEKSEKSHEKKSENNSEKSIQSVNTINSIVNGGTGIGPGTGIGRNLKVSDITPKAVVLYYCSALIGGVPGVIYITQTLLCLSSLTSKECFFLQNVDSVKMIEKNDKKDRKSSPFLLSTFLSLPNGSSRCPILLSFFCGVREITVVPLTVDSLQLQAIILEAKTTFYAPQKTT
jgi:hypothetical protein